MNKKMSRLAKTQASYVRDDINKKDWLTNYDLKLEANAQ